MAGRSGKGRSAAGDLIARRLLKLEREQGATNARLDVTNIRLEHLERLTATVVEHLGTLVVEFRGLRGDFLSLAAAVRQDRRQVDHLRTRVATLERKKATP